MIFSLGCKVNQYESGCIASELKALNYEVSYDFEKADIYIINTCAITNEAERKSRQAITRARKQNKNAKIIVIGCASENNPKMFFDLGVNLVKGTFAKPKLHEDLKSEGIILENPIKTYEYFSKAIDVNKYRTILKVQDGCNNYCSYCIIPYVRGASRSRLINDIEKELKALDNKTQEVVISGINLAMFGKDTGENIEDLVNLINKFNFRYRFGSIYGELITPDLLELLVTSPNFCDHFHLSLQSGSDVVLKDMSRNYTTKDFYHKVNLIRTYFPNAAITTDIIVGYPTETDEDFKKTLNFVNEIKFADIHIFKFSAKKGTAAYDFKETDYHIVESRVEKLNIIKSKLKKMYISKFINSVEEVVFEDEKSEIKRGYSRKYIRVYAKTNKQIALVKCTKYYKDGLWGEEIYE